jgi:hypothetical protein
MLPLNSALLVAGTGDESESPQRSPIAATSAAAAYAVGATLAVSRKRLTQHG